MDDRFHRFRPHPWHGLEPGPEPPTRLTAWIEITPFDSVKYEIDKQSGYLRVDRPQRTSALPPALYGFVPRTLCDARVSALMPDAIRGDGDPLDICVLSERAIARAEVLLTARVIGGIPMLDGGEADDKIVSVLEGDAVWSHAREIGDLPEIWIERLRHYFASYKSLPDEESDVRVGPAYGRAHAERVVEASIADYQQELGGG
ncbi:MAG TPA: inorganic pyrophosphatase [Myxococcota bacterium]|nr:inorganic pyrophosphatase [Myxococcota bacterium]